MLAHLLANRTEPAQPFITYYDLDTGERVELSTTTTLNWVAKTANFLVDELGAETGTSIRMALPSHWESYVWLLAAWRVGCVLTDDESDILVTGPEPDPAAAEIARVALSLRPLGVPFADPPAGYLDYNAEVLSFSDHFTSFDPPSPSTPAVNLDRVMWDHQQTVDAIKPSSERRLITAGDLMSDIRVLVAAALGGGALVLVRGGSIRDRQAIAKSEQAIAA